MSLDEKFNASAEKVKTFTKRPTDEELLQIYALFKQATVGDNDTEKPGLLDLKGKAKWSAWSEKKGMSKDAAKQAYIELVEKLSASYL
ncbi:acyl-CoA-binding protein homolog [Condylostylus longicornis]|uniref:acyl-CoA-binding protein homolog n=1 Tax=Condylostylus longicornis TaxID=2530218 RepID=UPI00244DCC9D|nr:acyl-CoA-binding protein homolog [Condylostylus longicornis]XP_055384131.1 acyl-CoA-binding protein homolog [Condylostylus longicornis]XP_055384132.1 acyl-CoA-binding protein homolog [Condylostylus longicornis]XP_055384133.1 acyl-CoA-binding protein homolog [Condylostylus longicornis]